MIQYQYIYKDDNELISKLSEIRKLDSELNASSVLIRIFSTVTDEKAIRNLCEIIDNEYPEALYIKEMLQEKYNVKIAVSGQLALKFVPE